MPRIQKIIFIVIVFHSFSAIHAQTVLQEGIHLNGAGERFDPCNFDSARAAELYELLGDGWGYTYDSLMLDLDRWRESPYVVIDSIGASVQNRALWQLTISDAVPSPDIKYRITIHARTHPSEVYSFYATRAIIRQLTGDSELARRFRHYAVFNIIPIYNPDGVELGYSRQNAKGVDLERDWDSVNPQPESAALKALYLSYMNSGLPINVALNMHNDGGAVKRYFVYHHENGTSVEYTQIERAFISGVHRYWPEGIGDWNAVITWKDGAPTYFPESWFWFNYGTSVLALTFEEIITGTEADFIRTAEALLKGTADFIGLEPLTDLHEGAPVFSDTYLLLRNYPNPFNPSTTIEFILPGPEYTELTVCDMLGRKVATLVSAELNQGIHTFIFNGRDLASGLYYCHLRAGEHREVRRMILFR